MVDQVRFAMLFDEKFFLAWASRVWNWLSAVKSPDAYPILSITQDSRIVTDSSMLGKPAFNLLVQFVGITNFREQANHNLRRKREAFTSIMVEQFVEREWCKDFAFPRLMAHPVGAFVCSLQSAQEQFILLYVGIQPDFSNQFHLFEV
jgi:hypothetical protein